MDGPDNRRVLSNALCTNDYKTLCSLMCIEECEDLIGETLKSENVDGPPEFSAEGLVNVESDVQVKYASVLEQYKEKLDEDYEYYSSSCERLHKKVMLQNMPPGHQPPEHDPPPADGNTHNNIV